MSQEPRVYTMGIAGEAQVNADGTSRQQIIKRCKEGERLVLKREPENPHDPNAVAVLRESGAQIGYVSRRNAEWVAPLLDEGRRMEAQIEQITGGGLFPRKFRGVIIRLTKYQ